MIGLQVFLKELTAEAYQRVEAIFYKNHKKACKSSESFAQNVNLLAKRHRPKKRAANGRPSVPTKNGSIAEQTFGYALQELFFQLGLLPVVVIVALLGLQ